MAPALLLSQEVRQTPCSVPLGFGRLHLVSHCSWLGFDLSKEAASLRLLYLLGQIFVPRAEIHASCPMHTRVGKGSGHGALGSPGTHLSR